MASAEAAAPEVGVNRPMRRSDRALTEEEAGRILEGGEYGVLSTCGADGWPYGAPLSYVWHEGRIYFHCAGEGHKLDNLAHCDRASFCVVGETHPLADLFSTLYESAIAFGVARECRDEGEKLAALLLLVDKYAPENAENGRDYARRMLRRVHVFRLDVLRLTGKARKK